VIGVGLAEAVRAMLGLVGGWAPCGSRLRLRGNGIEEASETGGRCGRGRVSGSKLVQLAAGSDFPPRYLKVVWALPGGKSIRTVDGYTRSRVGRAVFCGRGCAGVG
jgi:hypothetical protein